MSSERTETPAPEATKKVALLGFAESWKNAPFDDQTIEVWGLNELHKYLPRWNRWFEVHDADTLGITKRDLSEGEQKRHLEWLARDHGAGKRIYMQPQFCDGRFPNAVPWPLDEMAQKSKRGRYYTSSIAMMLHQAIVDGYRWIGLYGIDLASDSEYGDQRPCAEYYVGLAEGMGIEVHIDAGAAMCKAAHVYAFEKPPTEHPMLDIVRNHVAGLKKKHDETLALLNTLDGAMQECDNFLKMPVFMQRGVQLKTY